MIDAVAHWAVAIGTNCSIVGSASATAAGVMAEFSAVVPIAAPIAKAALSYNRKTVIAAHQPAYIRLRDYIINYLQALYP